jgi:hypothetical protein
LAIERFRRQHFVNGTHPPIERKRAALETFDRVLKGDAPVTDLQSQRKEHRASTHAAVNGATPLIVRTLLRKAGGRREARTRDLRVANAALSQLS